MSEEEIYCPRKKYTDTDRNLPSQKAIYYHRIKFDVTAKQILINFVEFGSISSQTSTILEREFRRLINFNAGLLIN